MEYTQKDFQDYLRKSRQYDHVLALMEWDMSTLAPRKGLEARVSAMNYFSTEQFRLATSDEYGAMLRQFARPEAFEKLDPAMQLTVKRYLRDYERFKRIPEDFYSSYVETRARSQKAWEQAKRENDFAIFAPWLEKVIDMTKQYARYMEPEEDPYEVLLDLYEEGMDSAKIDPVFDELKKGLQVLMKKIQKYPRPDRHLLQGHYDVEVQKKVQLMLLDYIGFDREAGATATSEHPFTTTIGCGDVRLTNHFYEDDPIPAIFSAIHEGGHAIFEQNVDPIYEETAVREINMMALHESQSRFYENMLGRRKSFWVPVYDSLGEYLPQFREIPLESFYRIINDVHPSMIRTEADEVSYGLHIILRYEMEKAIFHDDVPVEKLPGMWNDKMEELLGIRPESDAEGILQDMHWSDGSFGYFPSYLLGSVYDSMFLEAMERDLGDVDVILEAGRIKEITAWLNEKIHKNGSLYDSAEVLKRVCAEELSAQPLLDYFNKKYAEVYGFEE